MKKFFVILLFAAAAGVFAQSESDFEVTVANGAVAITKYTGSGGNVVIPARIQGLLVTGIGEDAFSINASITSILIPAGITSIGKRAFSGIVVDRVGRGTSAIDVDPRNTSYSSRDGVLFNKNATILIQYPIGKKEGQYAIPASVTSIGDYAFDGCTSLTSVSIPASITSIGDYAFYGCGGLTSVNIPASVTSIGKRAFSGHIVDWGSDVDAPSGIVDIAVDPRNTFYSSRDGVLFNKTATILVQYPTARKERQYAIPAGVTSIGEGAFAECRSLTAIAIPSSVTRIGESAFEWCMGLTALVIPPSVTSIGVYAFSGCTGLVGISVDPRNTAYTSRDGVLFNKAGDRLLKYPAGKKRQYAIPVGVTGIADRAFQDCTGLISISIPASVTSIGDNAFSGCTGLTDISVEPRNPSFSSRDGVLFTKAGDELILYPAGKKGQYAIPVGVTSIGGWAFDDCTGLTSITIPAGVTSIGFRAFEGCTGLTSVSIPASVTSIDGDAFENCIGLTSEQSGFKVLILGGAGGGVTITGYTGTATAVVIPARIQGLPVTSIRTDAFKNCTSLASISIPASVTSIWGMAFSGCTDLTSILVDTNNKNYISRDGVVFNKARDKLIAYPPGKKGPYAIPAGVTSIGGWAFFECTGLTSISIPASVTFIDWSAFADCTGLTSVIIPPSVTFIESYAFSGTGLTSITIGANVAIEATAFSATGELTKYYDRNGKKAGVYTWSDEDGMWSYNAAR